MQTERRRKKACADRTKEEEGACRQIRSMRAGGGRRNEGGGRDRSVF